MNSEKFSKGEDEIDKIFIKKNWFNVTDIRNYCFYLFRVYQNDA